MVSDSIPVEGGTLPGAEPAQRAVRAGRVGPVEYPVLPGGQPAEDLRFHGLWAGEPVVGLQAGERVGAEAGPLLGRDPDFLVPVDVIRREGDQAQVSRVLGFDRRAQALAGRLVAGLVAP